MSTKRHKEYSEQLYSKWPGTKEYTQNNCIDVKFQNKQNQYMVEKMTRVTVHWIRGSAYVSGKEQE